MTLQDLKYIEGFVDEVEALYLADDGDHYPEYLMDMIANIRIIISNEESSD